MALMSFTVAWSGSYLLWTKKMITGNLFFMHGNFLNQNKVTQEPAEQSEEGNTELSCSHTCHRNEKNPGMY